ncbi:hypothetical protein HDU76_002904, partial [Blyttiomyces sp. JEL0837]
MMGGFRILNAVTHRIHQRLHKVGPREHGVASTGNDDHTTKIASHSKKPSSMTRTFVCGMVSSAAALLLLDRSKRADISLFVAVRAIDSYLSYRRQDIRVVLERLGIPTSLLNYAAPLVFIFTSQEVMFSWFFEPKALPPSYNKWITRVSELHPALAGCLRHRRIGDLQYASPQEVVTFSAHNDTLWPPSNPELKNSVRQYLQLIGDPNGWSPDMGPWPCHLVHGLACTESCEGNAVYRWLRGFRQAFMIYLPVHLIPQLLFNPTKLIPFRTVTVETDQPTSSSDIPNKNTKSTIVTKKQIKLHLKPLRRVIVNALRSSAFLSTFIATVWYTICFFRTRIPQLATWTLGRDLATSLENRFQWLPALTLTSPRRDGASYGPWFGSFLCGLSVFLEIPSRRREYGLYVLPKALQSFV